MIIPLYDDHSYYVLMRNKQAFAKLLKVEAAELTFVKGTEAVFLTDRKRRDIAIGRYGLEGFDPVRVYYPHQRRRYSIDRYVGMQHFRCHNNKNLEYLVVSVPLYEESTDFIVCKKGDLYKIARHNRHIAISDLEIRKPVLEEDLINNVLKNTYLFIKNSKKIKQSGIRLRRGVILDGKPGNGKTMLCAYIDSLCQRDNISTKKISSTQIRKAYQEGKLEKMFWSADVIFCDDFDVSFFTREGPNAEIASDILTALDGLTSSKDCAVRIFTTNEKIDNLDPAFVRPGRIDAKYRINPPNEKLRLQLIKQWPKDIQDRIKTTRLVDLTDGLSFSQIEEIRSKMVINFYIDGKWDLEKALSEFNQFNEELKQKKMAGFAAA